MIISGLQNTTLLDYPGHVAATIFLGGCNYRCPFCHNASIVLEPVEGISRDELMSFLKKRRGVLDGVCVTGGEPTLHHDLLDMLEEIKALGLLVKLDTNGTNPGMIEDAVSGKLVDYIAMDVKSSLSGYGKAVGIAGYDTAVVEKSIRHIMNCGTNYEFRTTLVKNIHTLQDMKEIAALICGAKAYFLQSYRDNDSTIEKLCMRPGAGDKAAVDDKLINGCDSFSKEELIQFLDIARSGVVNASLRGVD